MFYVAARHKGENMQVLYRISSGEVLSVDFTDAKDYSSFIDNGYHDILSNPSTPNGTEICDLSGNRRVLGYAKIVDGATIRNATQEEIDTFQALREDDQNKEVANKAKLYFQNDPVFRRVMVAFAAIVVNEFNILRTIHGLPDRTLSQFKTAIINRISKDD